MHNIKREIRQTVLAADVPDGYAKYAWNQFVGQLGIKLAQIKNAEKIKDPNSPTTKKLVKLQKRTQFYKTPTRNLARHGVMVFPVGTKEEDMVAIARESLAKQFEMDQVDYFTAAHTHESGENPHVHFVIHTERLDGSKVDLRRDDIMQLRQRIADAAEKRHIYLHAGKAWERGVAKRHIPKFVLHQQMNKRLENNPELDEPTLRSEIHRDLKLERLAYAKTQGTQPRDHEVAFKRHINQQTRLFKLDADYFRDRFASQGKDADLKKAELIDRHIAFLKTSLPGRLQTLRQDEQRQQNTRDAGRDPGRGLS